MKGKLHTSISLSGKSALITGCGKGIGKAMADTFSDAGAKLILIDKDNSALENFKKTQNAVTHSVDISNEKEIRALWEKIDEAPNIIVNNAGIYPFEDFLQLSAEDLEKTLAINLKSIIWMCQEFVKRRKKKGGVIINVSSIEAILPFKEDLIPYSVSKSGVIALTRSLARDYGRRGFRANVILPGAIKTPGTKKLRKDAVSKLRFKLLRTGYDFSERLAMGRWGEPEEVAHVALFLASDLSSYVQGALIPVDGGFLSM